MRALGDPIIDLIAEKPYADQQSMFDGELPKGWHYYVKSEYLPGLSSEFLGAFRGSAVKMTSPVSESVIVHIGGALNEREVDDGVVGNRDARYVSWFDGVWPPDTPGNEHVAWARDAWESIRPTRRVHVPGVTGVSYVYEPNADQCRDR